MTTFETLEKHEIQFGNNNFLMLARKAAKSQEGDVTEFIAVTRGYIDSQGSKRYKTNLNIPPEPELVEFLQDALGDVLED